MGRLLGVGGGSLGCGPTWCDGVGLGNVPQEAILVASLPPASGQMPVLAPGPGWKEGVGGGAQKSRGEMVTVYMGSWLPASGQNCTPTLIPPPETHPLASWALNAGVRGGPLCLMFMRCNQHLQK